MHTLVQANEVAKISITKKLHFTLLYLLSSHLEKVFCFAFQQTWPKFQALIHLWHNNFRQVFSILCTHNFLCSLLSTDLLTICIFTWSCRKSVEHEFWNNHICIHTCIYIITFVIQSANLTLKLCIKNMYKFLSWDQILSYEDKNVLVPKK